MDDLYKINPSVQEKYRLEPDFWENPYETVNIKFKNHNNNNNIYLENKQEGNCWIIKNDNLFLLIPRKKYRGKKNFNKQEYFDFKLLFKLEGYDENKTRDFILQEPAEVYLHGKDWILNKKGILNFDTKLLSSSSAIELQGNKELNDKITALEKQLESLKKEIINKPIDLIPQQPNIDLESFKQEIIKEIDDLIPQQPNINLESFKQEIIKEISDRIPQQPNINLAAFKQEILDEIGDRNQQKSNIDLESFKQEIIREIDDRIPQQLNINLESFKQEIIKEIRESKQKKNNDIESSHEPISLEELQSLIKSYNSNPGLLASDSTMVAATRESIEQRRTGFNTPIIFTETENDSYWILHQSLQPKNHYFYLVPKAYLIINSRIYQTIEDIFACHNYANRSSNKFQLVQPAIVKLITDSEYYEDKWELVEPGQLNFS